MSRHLAFGLLLASILSATTPARAEPDYFVDSRGHRQLFSPIYEGWFGANRYPKRYGRAIAENGAMLAFELFLYWYDPNSNAADWQYPDLGKKFASNENIVFDDNMQLTNFLLHPLAGGAHYGLTRLNGFGVPVSFAAAAVSSALYEGVFEYMEVVSINDLIVTPIAGTAVGETLFQLGNYLNSANERPKTLERTVGSQVFGQRLARVTLGLPRRAHDIADEPPPPPAVEDDNLGLSSAYWHEFRLHAGMEAVRNDENRLGETYVLREETSLFAMPGFLRPGRINRWFGNGNYTATATKLAFSDRLREANVLVDAHLFGHFGQELEAGRGGVRGTAHEVAGRMALHYEERWNLDRHDFYARLHVLGPVATYWFCMGPTRIKLSADVSPDFAAVRSLAYEEWVAARGTQGTKSSLLLHGYYNAWGASAGLSATLTSGDFTIGTKARVEHYESIDGLERFHEKVTEEPRNIDQVLEASATIEYEPRGTGISARVDAAHIGRTSKMAPYSNPRYDQSIGISLGSRF